MFKYSQIRLHYILFCLVMMMSLSLTVQARDKIRITNGEWPPYLSENLPHYGIASRIITEAFSSEEIDVEYGFFPWARSLKFAEVGEWDGSAVWLSTAEREKLFYLSDDVFKSTWVFFHKKDLNFDWKNYTDLKPYVIGGTLEYKYSEEFVQAEKDGLIVVNRVPNDEQNFKLLVADRVQLFPNDLIVGYNMLKNKFQKEENQLITHHNRPLRVDPMHLLLNRVNPKNKIMMEKFNRGLAKLKQSGQLEKYLSASN